MHHTDSMGFHGTLFFGEGTPPERLRWFPPARPLGPVTAFWPTWADGSALFDGYSFDRFGHRALRVQVSLFDTLAAN
jgi:hypothetical protein